MGKQVDSYRLVDYFDVWGNEEEGWEVNDLHVTDTIIQLNNYTSKTEIVTKLKAEGFLLHSAKPNDIELWNDYEMIEIYAAATQEPLGRLELIQKN